MLNAMEKIHARLRVKYHFCPRITSEQEAQKQVAYQVMLKIHADKVDPTDLAAVRLCTGRCMGHSENLFRMWRAVYCPQMELDLGVVYGDE